jgi:hypothetical protein
VTVASPVTRNSNEAIVGLTESAFGGSLESGDRFYVGVSGRNISSGALKVFSHLIYFINVFYKCSFSAIFRDKAATICITVQHR